MAYKLYTDKTETFSCKVMIEGASLTSSKVRLVVSGPEYTLLFHGTVDAEGTCKIHIPKLKKVLSAGDSGTLTLEVIAEDAYFSP